MTRRDSLVIPLGFMLEVVWPDQARWLGLIGRTHLTPLELDLVHAPSRADITAPWKFLEECFDIGWADPAGTAGDHLAERHAFALHFARPEAINCAENLTVDSDDAWFLAQTSLSNQLLTLGRSLRPALTAPVIKLPPAPMPVAVVPVARPSTKVLAEAA
jgi:hypothetical protein